MKDGTAEPLSFREISYTSPLYEILFRSIIGRKKYSSVG